MTISQYVLLGLLVVAAIIAGYFIGRWSALRGQGSHFEPHTPSSYDSPSSFDTAGRTATPAPHTSEDRGAPPPVSAGASAAPSGNAPPASAGSSAGSSAPSNYQSSAPARRRGPPPPAAAGLMGTGDTGKS